MTIPTPGPIGFAIAIVVLVLCVVFVVLGTLPPLVGGLIGALAVARLT